MHPAGLHLGQELVHFFGFRHEVCRPQQLALSRDRVITIHDRQQVLGIEHADNVIDRVLIDWHARVPRLDELAARVADGGVHL